MKLTPAVLVLAFALVPAVVRAAELSVKPTSIVWNAGQTPRITVQYFTDGRPGNSRVENGCPGLLVNSGGRTVNRTGGKWEETADFTLRVNPASGRREPCSLRFVYGEKIASVSVSFPQAERPANYGVLLLDPAAVVVQSGQSVRVTARIVGPRREPILGSEVRCRPLGVILGSPDFVTRNGRGSASDGPVETVEVFTARSIGRASPGTCEFEFRTMETRKLVPVTVKP